LSLFAVLIALIFGGVASWPINEFLWTNNLQKVSAWGTLLFFITVPVVAFMTWLIRRVVNARRGAHLGWIFGGLWIIGWICAITFAASIAKDLRVYDKADPIKFPIAQPSSGKLIVKVNEPEIHYSGTIWWMHDDNAGWDISDDNIKYNRVKIRVDKSDDSLYHVIINKYSAGSSLNDVQSRASKTVFNVGSVDSILNLGSGLLIDKSSKFRGQGVIVEIEIPVGKKIRFDESVMYAYNDWVIRKTGRTYHWHWQSDWDEDYSIHVKANTDYMMNDKGDLVNLSESDEDVENPDRSSSADTDSLQRIQQEQKRIKDSIDREINKTNQELRRRKNKNPKDNPDESTTMMDIDFSPLII
jgi:ToastRack found in some PspC/PspC transmembrane region